MKRYIILALVTIFYAVSQAQDIVSFYHNIYIADSLYLNNELESSCAQFEKTIGESDFVHSRVLRKALIVSKEANSKILNKKVKILLNIQKPCPDVNVECLKKIDSLFKLDQKVRTKKYWNASQYYFKHKMDTSQYNTVKFLKAKKLYSLFNKTDSTNIRELLGLIDRYGYLGEQELGANNYFKFQTILLHFDADTNNLILGPILRNALYENKITPFTYSHIIDRHLYNTSKTQKYWTWFMVDSDPELTAGDIDEILILRKSIGMFGTKYKVLSYKDSWMLNNLSRTTY